MDPKEMLLRAATGIGLLVVVAYLGITRDKAGRRVQRANFLFGVIFILFAMVVGTSLVSTIASNFVTLTAGNYESSMLMLQILINVVVGIPGLALLLRLVSMRCRDAGYRPGIAYLGAIPIVQFFFILWLMFPKPVAPETVPSAA